MNTFQANSWAIELLDGWVGEHDDECSTIYHPGGVGALQISSYLKDSEVDDSDLISFAQDHIESGAKLAKALAGRFRGITLAFCTDDQFWQYWYVANKNVALLITYNCDESDVGQERYDVKNMVASLTPT